MKKLSLLVMPLMAVLFLANCNKATDKETPLCFEANVDNSTVGYGLNVHVTNIQIQISRDNNKWDDWSGDAITLNKGEKIYVHNLKDTLSNEDNYFYFMMSGEIAASGNVDSMINYKSLYASCYLRLFENCSALVSAPSLPNMQLAPSCYSGMFSGCTHLKTSPELPATTLAPCCYFEMFSGCNALANAPVLPATTLELSCYASMFKDCHFLEIAPALPATTLGKYCYHNMFYNCRGLKQIPTILPAGTLTHGCYYYMFQGCTNIVTAPKLPAKELVGACYGSMFSGCKKLKISENSGQHEFFVCPHETGVDYALIDMFAETGGSFVEKPTADQTYYYND